MRDSWKVALGHRSFCELRWIDFSEGDGRWTAKGANDRRKSRIALLKHFARKLLLTSLRYGDGRGCGVGRSLGAGYHEAWEWAAASAWA